MIAPWVAPGNQLYLVAYEGADGKPYAVAVSAYDLARKLAQHFNGEAIETAVDRHADLAADSALVSHHPE
jgi:hypothetical protein